MKRFNFKTQYVQMLSDTTTPVNIYLKIRDNYPNSLLLESSDYNSADNSFSYICFNPIASIKLEDEIMTLQFPDNATEIINLDNTYNVPEIIQRFSDQFSSEKTDFKFITNGLFGYISYDAVRYFEKIKISEKENTTKIPDLHYAIYQNIIVINHFKQEAYIFCHTLDGSSNIAQIQQLLQAPTFPVYQFKKMGESISNLTDAAFRHNVNTAKNHCWQGDVFQLVLSRRFSQSFKGDEFNVYRALRSINHSPYLFFFDYGSFKIFGSSPEANLIVKNGVAEIHPIAGTFKRSDNEVDDILLAKSLSENQKENSEHVMLVDLARNDLSRNSTKVTVEKYSQIQFFSHVIHLISKVTGVINRGVKTMQIVADTFPAGTLTGAPKHNAMQLIDKIETSNRNFYGGAIGFMDFDGNFNHAIMIRTFLSKNHTLHYQAGAGIVVNSDEESELQEVYNKLAALTKAMDLAEQIN